MHARLQAFAATLLLLPLAGCFVQTKKSANGDNVDISTPLGGMTVKTDSSTVQAKVGLPLYPGAVPEKKKDNDSSSADVNMNFGPFHLRVLAMGFTTPDSPEKVSAFYRKALASYGDVLTCQGNKPVGSPNRTGLGLTCSDDNRAHAGTESTHHNYGVELKAGSPSRQHIVSYESKDGGTHFGLVALELPGKDGDETAN